MGIDLEAWEIPMTINLVVRRDRMEDAGSSTFWPNRLLGDYLDAMDAIFCAIRERKGKIDPDKTIRLLRNYRNPNSPCGAIAINPESGDIIQNEYLREVRKVRGDLANVEIETIATQLKDPLTKFSKKKTERSRL